MAPRPEGSRLKRGLPGSVDEEDSNLKKPRRAEKMAGPGETPLKEGQLPSPLTHQDSTSTERDYVAGTVTPPNRDSKPPSQQLFSPPHHRPSSPSQRDGTQTQPFSQASQLYSRSYEVEDEEGQGVWGYLVPIDPGLGKALVLRKRTACPLPSRASKVQADRPVPKDYYINQEKEFQEEKAEDDDKAPSGGYLVGRHQECDRIINIPTVSNRHFLIYNESKNSRTVAVLEDLSVNGTVVNGNELGRNKRVQLNDGDVIEVAEMASFTFRYPQKRVGTGFHTQYQLGQQLGKGHFASVFMCVDRTTGTRYAVKKFEKRTGPGERSRVEGLQQEIAVLMSVSHPSLLCLDDTYDEEDGVYLVLELAAEGELFNYIVMKQKLSEVETRKIFVQLFQALKYLHERNIVHRDIKPENILLTDKNLTVKLADFGLAKIIGEESFTTTLCGTPSYVAPEILKNSKQRRYTNAVDVWSLGVVLYICLCGFPPFSEELCTPQNPYSLAQQILSARFDYPSPYWDSVGDPALDLIDKMLVVDPDQRITIDECLQHPWTRDCDMAQSQWSHDSTDSLNGAMAQLDFSKRKPKRERTLLSTLNDVRVSQVMNFEPDKHGHEQPPVKVFEKNKKNPVKSSERQDLTVIKETGGAKHTNGKEPKPVDGRAPAEFMETGGVGDEVLFSDEGSSRYVSSEAHQKAKEITHTD